MASPLVQNDVIRSCVSALHTALIKCFHYYNVLVCCAGVCARVHSSVISILYLLHCTDETIAALRKELADERQSKEELIRTWKMANEEFMRMQMDQEQETKNVHQQLDVARR